MIDKIMMRLLHVYEHIMINGLVSFFRETIYLNRTAILVEKNLSDIEERPGPIANAGLKLIEIDADTLLSGGCRFAVNHRRLKALHYVKQGFRGHAITRDNLIIGEIWYYASETTTDSSELHSDLKWLGFKNWSKDYVYSFDIFVCPTERQNGVSAALQNNAMVSIRSKGFSKAYAYYWGDNIPAVWNTRVINKWKELDMFCVSRFLLFKNAVHVRKIQSPEKTLP